MSRDTNGDSAGRSTPQGTHTFQDIISSLIQHPSLALLIKKVFDVCSSTDIPLPASLTELSEADKHYTTLGEFARTHGIPRAMQCSSHTDILMAALLGGLEQLKLNGPSSGMKGILRSTFAECEIALSQLPSQQGLHPSENALNTVHNRNKATGLHPSTRKGVSTRLKDSSRQILREWFDRHYDKPYPSEGEKAELAFKAGVSIKQVNVFFGNRRMRIKRKMMAMPASQGQSRGLDPPDGLSAQAKWDSVVAKMHMNPREPSGCAAPPGMQLREGQYSAHGITNGSLREIHPPSISTPSFSQNFFSSNGGHLPAQDSAPHIVSVESTTNNRLTERESKFNDLPSEYSTNNLHTPAKDSHDSKYHVYLWLQSHLNNPVLTKEEKMQVTKFSRLNLRHWNHSHS